MKSRKRLGIWMDNAHAHLKEYHREVVEIANVDSDEIEKPAKSHLVKGVSSLHNMEQPLQTEFYKSIAREILEFNDVLLFGPAEAKTELFNLLKDDQLYANIKFNIQNSGPLSDKQERAVIKTYFK